MSSRHKKEEPVNKKDPRSAGPNNPYIPTFISKAPWYADDGKAAPNSMQHQKLGAKRKVDDQWYERGSKQGPAATKYRKGACENCGAMTHKTKECMERPRKVGARWTNQDIAADEVVQELEFGWDAKRDRWNGYDATDQLAKIEEFELLEEERRKLKQKELEEKLLAAQSGDVDAQKDLLDSDDSDDEKYGDDADMPGQGVEGRMTVRNLRIREDVAKYLQPENSGADYNPKSRSFRKNPNNLDNSDSFVKHDPVKKLAQLETFAWDASAKEGVDVHVQANPTQADLMFKQHQQKRTEEKEAVKGGLLAKYGGEEHLQVPPKEVLFNQTEEYVEYDNTGEVIKGQTKQKNRSKYAEDLFLNNHTSVWGSWWSEGRWGYACCHSIVKNSFCTGEAGKQAAQDAANLLK